MFEFKAPLMKMCNVSCNLSREISEINLTKHCALFNIPVCNGLNLSENSILLSAAVSPTCLATILPIASISATQDAMFGTTCLAMAL